MSASESAAASTSPADAAVRVDLPQDQQAPAQARRAARDALAAWRLPGLVDNVVLAVSELVTNAVRYGRPTVSLELLRRPSSVRVAVHDGEPVSAAGVGGRTASLDAESGRGLSIVQALAADIAVEPVADDGKVVRVDFDVPPEPQH